MMVPMHETLGYIQELFPGDTVTLSEHAQTIYFQCNNNFYKQTHGVTMESPLGPVIANFYVERSEEKTLCAALVRPHC